MIKQGDNQEQNTTNEENTPSMTSEDPQSEVVTVVLTANNHLGYDAFGLHKREEWQRRLRDAFQQATNFAIAQRADLFIQAGDLFDTTAPDERDRSFVAARLAQLKQAGVRAIALGGVHDTPSDAQDGNSTPALQISYAQLGALQYLQLIHKGETAETEELEPLLLDIHGILVGVCGLGILADQEGDPLAHLRVRSEIECAAIPMLVLHAPIEGLTNGASRLDTRAQVSRNSIEQQTTFRYILAGYQHTYSHMHIGQTDVIVAGATLSTRNVTTPGNDQAPGFVFMGLASDGVRWCNHVSVDALQLQQLVISTKELWSDSATSSPTERILEQLEPLCGPEAILQMRLEGELTRMQYHQLDLNKIRRYGEGHCFALFIDDSGLSLLVEQDAVLAETGERLSPREELIAVADEWIDATDDEQEKKALRNTKEDLLLAMDDSRGKR